MATLTITTTSAQDARLVAAFGTYLGLEGNATAAQIKQNVINYIKQVVRDQEYKTEVDAISVPPIEPT